MHSLGLVPLAVGLFGIHISFKHPFGSHSLFHKATQVASVLPIPFGGLIGKATSLFNRARPIGAVWKAARNIVTPLPTAMPGGATVRAAPPSHRAHKHRAASRARRPTHKRKRR